MTIKIIEKDGSYYAGNIVATTAAIEQDLINRGKAVLLDRDNYEANFAVDASDNIIGLKDPKTGRAMESLQLSAFANGVLTKYGATAFDICQAPGTGNTMIIGVTDLTHSVTNDYPRHSNYTRKCVCGATGTSQIRFVQMNAFDPDPVEKSFSFDMYLPDHPNEFTAGNLNPYIDVEISASNTTGIGSNYSRWSFGTNSLRQGWNTIKIRQADTVSATSGTGNLPYGVSHSADVGTGFDWTVGDARCLVITFNRMANKTVYVDQIRRPAKAKPVLIIGFDATGYSATDEVPVTKVAPLFAAHGFGSYCTFTWVYDMFYAGTQGWNRMANLQNNYGWDMINHTWNHGATVPGRNSTLSSLVASADVCTATFPAVHGLTIGTRFKANISGASIAAANGVQDITVTTTLAGTYTAAGAGTATASGTIILNTFLSEVLSTNTPENIRITRHEMSDIAIAMRATGFARASNVIAYPNNAVPELSLMQDAANYGGIDIGRGSRNGYSSISEFGIDNPLNMGSYELGSGATATTTSYIAGKIQGAVDRGEHIWLYGHFILDENDPAMAVYKPAIAGDTETAPASSGNPNPPAAGVSSTGGWWYLGQLTNLVNNTIGPLIANGSLLVMTPSEYSTYMGFTR